jgi:hypothetical protein
MVLPRHCICNSSQDIAENPLKSRFFGLDEPFEDLTDCKYCYQSIKSMQSAVFI